MNVHKATKHSMCGNEDACMWHVDSERMDSLLAPVGLMRRWTTKQAPYAMKQATNERIGNPHGYSRGY